MEEEILIQTAQNGDLPAFNRLVLSYQARLYNLCYRILGDEDAAADATQEAFISAYKNLRSYRGGSFKSWLMRIATNACYDELRRRKRRPATSWEDLPVEPDTESAAPSPLFSIAESPSAASERAEMSRAVQKCLSSLPEDQRVTVVLCDVQGYDYNEISVITKVQLGTVKSRLARARGSLRNCLRGLFSELLPDKYRLANERT
ncbi:MAG TPA: sigma-70 family RNA polymerase sigma factor [Anaerolineales bacterium]|nr:sigma-70 family RNA polymerase sigma factor [Anaerolineales bacterium]